MTSRCHLQLAKNCVQTVFYCIPPGMGIYSLATHARLCKCLVLLTKRLNGKALCFRTTVKKPLVRIGSDTPLVNVHLPSGWFWLASHS
jgi:hypothetical protein